MNSAATKQFAQAWLGLLSLSALLLPVAAQTDFYTIQTNGPAANRLNVVFLSEGYTTAELPQFLVDVTNACNLLFEATPYTEYRSYCNAFAIAVASSQSGSDHPVSNTFRNTYFNSTYGSSDYIMTIPAGDTGHGKVNALLNTYMPESDLAILLVNDRAIGGSDGGGGTAIVAMSPWLSEIMLHECGHVLANLGDEYADANPGYPDVEEPNTTRETNRAAIKWSAWISTNTPVPTPLGQQYASVVGLFEGAHYHSTGWYRPKQNCRMNSSFDEAYCEVCSEALVLSIYRQARPIKSFSPATTNLLITGLLPLDFSLIVLQPATHSLNVEWLTNGVVVPSATNTTFSILPAMLGNGTNTVASRVTDPTPLVRTDTGNLLSQTLSWTVAMPSPKLELTNPRWLPPGEFAFRVAGVAPLGFAILASTNLIHWQSVATNTLVSGQYDYTNNGGSNQPWQFYRAVTAP